MKKELIGILICTLLISVAVAPAVNALTIEKNEINEVEEQTKTFNLQNLPHFQVSESNRIVKNNFKLNPPRAAPWPPYNERIQSGFGVISNPKRVEGDCSYYWSFNCIYVRCVLVDEYGRQYNRLFKNNEVRYLIGDPIIITRHFMISPLPPHFYFFLIIG